jgi:hypothetical protein
MIHGSMTFVVTRSAATPLVVSSLESWLRGNSRTGVFVAAMSAVASAE